MKMGSWDDFRLTIFKEKVGKVRCRFHKEIDVKHLIELKELVFTSKCAMFRSLELVVVAWLRL